MTATAVDFVNDVEGLDIDTPVPYTLAEPVNPAPRAAVLQALDIEPALVEESYLAEFVGIANALQDSIREAKAMLLHDPASATDLLIQALDRALAALQP